MDVHPTKSVRARRAMRPPQRFTLESANRSLPLVRRIVTDIVKEYEHIAQVEARTEEATSAGRSEAVVRLRDEHANGLERLRDLSDELAQIGCELKDGEKGLVDFPAVRDGCDIYLCWRIGEERVEHWHELDAGFAGRRRVPADFGA